MLTTQKKALTTQKKATAGQGGTITRLAVATLASGLIMQPALGRDQNEIAKQPQSMPDMFTAMANDTTIDLGLRNFYFNRDFRDKSTDNRGNTLPGTAESWSQGARVDLQSGYFADIIGFDASWFGALKLIGEDDKFGSGALRQKSSKVKNGKVVANQESYDKIGQAYLKARFGDDNINAHLKAGRMLLDTPLLNDSNSRTTPSSTQGILAELEVYKLGFYGIFSDKASGKTESGFHSYKNANGDTWNVGILGASFALENGLAFHAATGKADKYIKQNFLNGSYTLDLGSKTALLLDGYYQTSKDDGRYYDGKLDSKLWNLASRLSFDNLSFMLSFQSVIGDSFDYCWDGCNHDDNGLITWNAVQYLDFNKKNEKSWQSRVDYSFDNWGIPGLSIMARYVTGEFKDTKKVSEWERNTDLRYTFKNGTLEGLAITWRNATVRSATKGNSIDENRLIIDYTIPLI
ncbi:OprD family outer membrane porin [Parendozoicomonas sp. Alg238-R29]|uniref:OprD family outer membrane porin n=1 Tax=Parendozoicomonas sp. Alg238-R29 TaxID=2993446 RepID=UPI00248E27BA|nr:OprD family outer membrane porin [Parendozoicomonas sp. Alg238-R29]